MEFEPSEFSERFSLSIGVFGTVSMVSSEFSERF